MSGLALVRESMRGRRVLLTGHTGFKGAWLRLWLEALGAEVAGFSLPAEADSLHSKASLPKLPAEQLADIRDRALLREFVAGYAPEIVFHLAAQPLVSAGYEDSVYTFETNVLGTMNILETTRSSRELKGCVVVTTDKVYRPAGVAHRHVERDPLGGTDPYSASKAAAEHVVATWASLLETEMGAPVVAARAGNVIGGGDFAANRLLPDLMRSFLQGRVASIRHPDYTRPWQHVLDPLFGYLLLAARMLSGLSVPAALNFGPSEEFTVAEVATMAATDWGAGAAWERAPSAGFKETQLLALDSSLATDTIGWCPVWDTPESVRRTVDWWRAWSQGAPAAHLCEVDLREFMAHVTD